MTSTSSNPATSPVHDDMEPEIKADLLYMAKYLGLEANDQVTLFSEWIFGHVTRLFVKRPDWWTDSVRLQGNVLEEVGVVLYWMGE